MAENTTKKDNATKKEERRVTVRLPRLQGQNAIQEEFFSVNGKNYIITRGETVEIPYCVAKLIEDNEKAEDYALQYIDNLNKKANTKEDKALN